MAFRDGITIYSIDYVKAVVAKWLKVHKIEIFLASIWNLYYFFISYVKIFLQKKKFDQAIIGGDTIFPLNLRLSGIEFSLVWD